MELLIGFGLLFLSLVGVWLATQLPRLGIVLGVALAGAALYYGVALTGLLWEFGLVGVLLYAIVLVPVIAGLGAGWAMVRAGMYVLNNPDTDEPRRTASEIRKEALRNAFKRRRS